MASYPPPTQNVPEFDTLLFQPEDTGGVGGLTLGQAKTLFLQYPNAQGDENLQGINVIGSANFLNTVSIPDYPNVKNTLDGLASVTTGLSYSLATDTTSIDNSLNVVGTLSIPSYPNVKDTLDTISNSTTGITYTAGTDTTTIDNSLNVVGSYSSTNGDINLTNGSLKLNTGTIELNPTTGAKISYNSGGKNLNIRSGTTTSKITLDTYDAGGTVRTLDIDSSKITVPQQYMEMSPYKMRLYGNDFLGVGRTGILFTDQVPSGSSSGSVPMGCINVINELLEFDVNCGNVGTSYDNNKQGVQFRFDSRTGQSAFSLVAVEKVSRIVREGLTMNDAGVCSIYQRLELKNNVNMDMSGTGIISQAGTGTNSLKTTNITDLNVSGTLSIPSYSNVKTTLDTLSSSTTGITYTAGTDTTTIDNSLNVVGTLSIPSYSNVKTTLDTLSSSTTGITYDSGTDTTTIDNSLNITGQTIINPSTPITGFNYTARYRDATTDNNLDIILNPPTSLGTINGIIQAGDAVIAATTSNKVLTLTNSNSSSPSGIRLYNNIVDLKGTIQLSNANVTGTITSGSLITGATMKATNGITIGGIVSTSIIKSGNDLWINGSQNSSRLLIKNKDSGGTTYDNAIISTNEVQLKASEFSYRNLTATTGDAYIRMITDTNNVYIEPREIGSSALKNLRFITNGGSTAHLGIDSADGAVVIATNTPATGCKLTVNGKTQTTDLDVSGNLAIPSYPNVKTTLDSLSTTTTNTTGITYNAGTDTTTIDNSLNVVGILSIPSYPDVKDTLDDLTSSATGIYYISASDTTMIDNSLNVTGTLSIPSYNNVKTTLDTLSSSTTGITYTAGTDTTYIDNSLNVVGTFSIPSYNNVKTTLDTLSSSTTGITYTAGTDTTSIDNSLNVVGTFSIPSYNNVKTTLDTLTANATGITYTAGTDTTSIDNSLNVTGTLSIPSYNNVKTTLDTLSSKTTDINYNSTTDTTTIDGSLNVVGRTTLNGLTTISGQFGVSNTLSGTDPHSFFTNSTNGNNFQILLNPSSGNYNNLVQAGDIFLLGVGGLQNTRNIVIGTWNNSTCGIRLTSSTVRIGGALTTDSITQNANSNFNQSGTSIIIQQGTGTNTFKASSFYGSARFYDVVAPNTKSTQMYKSGDNFGIIGVEANSTFVVQSNNGATTQFLASVATNRLTATENIIRSTETTTDAALRITTDATGVYLEPKQNNSTTLENLYFRTNGTTTAHLGIDSTDGAVVIATNTPATGCKLTVNGKTQTTDLDVSGNLAIPTYPNVKTTLDTLTTNATGITYTAGTDTTSIDNSLNVVGTTTLNGLTTINGTYPILITPVQPSGSAGSSRNGILLSQSPSIPAGLVLEQTTFGRTLAYGINEVSVGTRDTALRGAVFRLDTRSNVSTAFSILVRPAGSATLSTAFDINENSSAIFYGNLTVNGSYFGTRGDSTSNYIGINVASGATTAAQNNVCIGNNAGAGITNSGTLNVLVGFEAGKVNNNSHNVSVGYQSLLTSTSNQNVAVGSLADNFITTGAQNTSVGYNSGAKFVATSSYNTCIGRSSGNAMRGSNNTAVGASAYSTDNGTFSNSTAIGYNAQVTASNQVVLGTATESVIIPNRITYQDSTNQNTAYTETCLNACDILTQLSGNNILIQTWNWTDNVSANIVTSTKNLLFFTAIKLIKGVTYNGIGAFIGTAGTWTYALYDTGLGAARLAITNSFTSTANTMNFQAFTTAYTPTRTGIFYIGHLTTSDTQTASYSTNKTQLQWNYATTTGTLKGVSIYYSGTSFPATIPTGQAMTNTNQVIYAVMYN